MVKSPVEVDTVENVELVLTWTAVTLASGTAAPSASVTEPDIVPRSVCASRPVHITIEAIAY